MKYVDIRDLPPCSFSPQCLRLIDDLDLPPTAPASTRLAYIEDLQDERHLRQLRAHVPGCPTCSALLIEARRTRTQQRLMLYHFMVANERQVPATSGAIFEAIRRENHEEEDLSVVRKGGAREERGLKHASPNQDVISAFAPIPLYARATQRRRLLQNMLTLATVAAVLLAAVGLLNRFAVRFGTTTSSQSSQASSPQQTPPPGSTGSWGSAMVGITLLSASGMVDSWAFYNYDTSGGRMETLISSARAFVAVNVEAVSSDGLNVLYDETSANRQKIYSTFAPAPENTTHHFYQVGADLGGNALWMDATHVLVQNIAGSVQKVDTQTGVSQQSWPLQTRQLTFYRQPFLYFIGAENLVSGALYRADLAQANPTPQRITNSLPDTRFWLSIDGTTIFYANQNASGAQGIYAIGSNGTHFRLLRAGAGIPIGYADDNALMIMEQSKDTLQVIKLGTTPGAPEKVILSNAAPHATSLCGPSGLVAIIKTCDQNIALAPYGHGLLLHTWYADGTNGLVYDNLSTGKSQLIRSLPANASVQLPGWSNISTAYPAASALDSQAACLCA